MPVDGRIGSTPRKADVSALGLLLLVDFPDSGRARRPADRRELRRAAGADGDGGTQPRSRIGAAPAAARYRALSQLLPRRAADLRVRASWS